MTALRVSLAAVSSIVFLALIGFLTSRAEAIGLGVSLHWNNELESVVTPGAPWLQYAAIAALSVAIIALWWPTEPDRSLTWLPLICVAGVLIGFIAWFFFTTNFPYSGAVRSVGVAQDLHSADAAAAMDSPLIAWLRAGALSPAAQVTAVMSLLVAWKSGINDGAKTKHAASEVEIQN